MMLKKDKWKNEILEDEIEHLNNNDEVDNKLSN